jgi:hypothetical protein
MIVIQYHQIWGNRWKQIAELLPGRTENGVKNRWRTALRREPTELPVPVLWPWRRMPKRETEAPPAETIARMLGTTAPTLEITAAPFCPSPQMAFRGRGIPDTNDLSFPEIPTFDWTITGGLEDPFEP